MELPSDGKVATGSQTSQEDSLPFGSDGSSSFSSELDHSLLSSSATPTPMQRLYNETLLECYAVSREVVAWATGKKESEVLTEPEHRRVLKRSILEMYQMHPDLFRATMRYMSSSIEHDATAVLAAIESVVDQMLSDNRINWGRIVAVLSLVYSLLRDLHSKGLSGFIVRPLENAPDFAYEIGNLLYTRFSSWINVHGGWTDLSRHFKSEEDRREQLESTFYNGLLVAGVGLLGLAALLSYRSGLFR